MSLSAQKVRQHLNHDNLKKIFVEDLGWDIFRGALSSIQLDQYVIEVNGVAEKRGFPILQVHLPMGMDLQNRDQRRKIENEVLKLYHEHILVLVDPSQNSCYWIWTKKVHGKGNKVREVFLDANASVRPLVDKLKGLAIDFGEEANLSFASVVSRVSQSFDVDRVTKIFYDRFQKEHSVFLGFIKGITNVAHREWYASLMLNRLMFVYFIQKRGFLDNDINYLNNRLERIPALLGKGKFHSFYKSFLTRLFHEGLGSDHRTKELEFLIGRVPYFNGGLFENHSIEISNSISIPDEAFERIFKFFDSYTWHLNDTPVKNENEINPDVIGYIFEKYINQKDLGAYYTKEDITDYISSSTIVPLLLDKMENACKEDSISFNWIWSLVKKDPERYLSQHVLKGVKEALPSSNNKKNISLFLMKAGLPRESFDEYKIRRQRVESYLREVQDSQVSAIDIIRWNIDLNLLVTDIIEQCQDPRFLIKVWNILSEMKILDPTCGSGAFLFAALRSLEKPVESCISKMHEFLFDEEYTKCRDEFPSAIKEFEEIINDIGRHPNRRYFVLKKIVLRNLYGVDIVKEAVEICKLRLFLELTAQLNSPEEIEPLPDLDFNIKSGNTLVGFETFNAAKSIIAEEDDGQQRALTDEERKEFDSIEEEAQVTDAALRVFRHMQQVHGAKAKEFYQHKIHLAQQLDKAKRKLTDILYKSTKEYRAVNRQKWEESHTPLHWTVDFYSAMSTGGFDVIIGNPPYKQISEISNYKMVGYKTIECGNIYAVVMERCTRLSKAKSATGMIVPVSSISTDGYGELQKLYNNRACFFSSYNDRPSKLFEGLESIRLSINLLFSGTSMANDFYTTGYLKWFSEERSHLFHNLHYVRSPGKLLENSIPKLQTDTEVNIVRKILASGRRLSNSYVKRSSHSVIYTRKVRYFLQILNFVPKIVDGKGRLRPPSELKELYFSSKLESEVALAMLNSTLFFWFFSISSDCRNLNRREIDYFPIDLAQLVASKQGLRLRDLGKDLMADFKKNSETRVMTYKHDKLKIQCIIPRKSKSIIDQIDRELGSFLGFTEQELNYILNYDIKFRLGGDSDDE